MKVNDSEAAYTHVFNQAEVAVDGTKKDTDSPVHTLPEDPARTPVYVLDDPVKAVLNVDGKNIGTDGNGNMIQTVKQAGDMLFYTVSFGNPADDERTFTITDKLPDGVKFVSADQEGVYSEADHTVTWNVITDAHTEGTVTVKVKVLASAAETELNNQARVGMDEADITTVTDNGGDDDDTTTNFVAVKTVVNAEGTEIDKQVVAVDDLVTYHIPYQNHSKNTRTITIMDVLPQDVTYVEASEGGNVQSIVHGQTGISAYDRIAEIAGGADGTSITFDN